jgi:hypothetical protein
MVIVALLLLALLAVALWLLLAPFSLRLDTYRDEYYLKWHSIGSARLLLLEGELAIGLRLGPWRKQFYPLRPGAKPKAEEEKPALPHPAKAKKPRRPFPWRKMRRVLRTFRVREFQLEIDTDDFARNAWLFPLVHSIGPLRRSVHVNFLGRNEGVLVVQNRLWDMGWAWVVGSG